MHRFPEPFPRRAAAVPAAALLMTAAMIATALIGAPVRADDKAAAAEKPQFMRVTRNEHDKPLALQVAVVRYATPAGAERAYTVDLIGAVHIGEEAYYEQLNNEFKSYDVVLYELVAPKGTRVPRPGDKQADGSPRSGVSAIQMWMRDKLALAFQLEEIDYSRENLVHADMSWDEFAASMKARNESPLTMFMQMMRASVEAQAKRKRPPPNEYALLGALMDKDNGQRWLKQILAGEMEESDTLLEALNGPEGSTIITERNRVAFDVLKEQIDAGKKTIGVFYGAGHLPDMERRLLEEFGLKKGEVRWLTAWDLTTPKLKKKSKPVDKEAEKAAASLQ